MVKVETAKVSIVNLYMPGKRLPCWQLARLKKVYWCKFKVGNKYLIKIKLRQYLVFLYHESALYGAVMKKGMFLATRENKYSTGYCRVGKQFTI